MNPLLQPLLVFILEKCCRKIAVLHDMGNLLANVSEVVGNPSIICNRVPEGTATLKKTKILRGYWQHSDKEDFAQRIV